MLLLTKPAYSHLLCFFLIVDRGINVSQQQHYAYYLSSLLFLLFSANPPAPREDTASVSQPNTDAGSPVLTFPLVFFVSVPEVFFSSDVCAAGVFFSSAEPAFTSALIALFRFSVAASTVA